jgi:hypothetical protein
MTLTQKEIDEPRKEPDISKQSAAQVPKEQLRRKAWIHEATKDQILNSKEPAGIALLLRASVQRSKMNLISLIACPRNLCSCYTTSGRESMDT